MEEDEMKRLVLMMLVLGLSFSAQIAKANWTLAKRLTRTSGWSFRPAIAIDSSNTIHVVWQESTLVNSDIYYIRSPDGGATWSTVMGLTRTSGESWDPEIAIDSSNTIHVVWEHLLKPGNFLIYYRRSPDGGATWSAVKRLTRTSGELGPDPAIAIDSSNTIHVVWTDAAATPSNYEIYYRRSPDGGKTWSAVKRLTRTSDTSSQPAIAIDSSNTIHVVWQDYTAGTYPWSGNYEIYYRRSPDGGATWSTVIRLTQTSGFSLDPAIAIDSSNAIHVVWRDDTAGNDEIYYMRSPDGGATWRAVKRLSRTSGDSWDPAIAIDSSNTIHVVWAADMPGNYNEEIYYMRSADGGTTWSAVKRLTRTSDISVSPAIAIDTSNIIHVVWTDHTPGNYEIYYMRSK
jgi:Neuraminidase (sialidase)